MWAGLLSLGPAHLACLLPLLLFAVTLLVAGHKDIGGLTASRVPVSPGERTTAELALQVSAPVKQSGLEPAGACIGCCCTDIGLLAARPPAYAEDLDESETSWLVEDFDAPRNGQPASGGTAGPSHGYDDCSAPPRVNEREPTRRPYHR